MVNEEYEDDIMRELHETRHKIMARFNNDFKAYFAYLAAHPVPGARYVRLEAQRLEPFDYPPVPTPVPPMACEGADATPPSEPNRQSKESDKE